VKDLRAAGPRRVRVDVGADPGWAKHVPGVTVCELDGDALLLELDPSADSQRVLDAARRAGPVTSFGESRPTLAELFRELVAP
jgi:ABC-2 type transport system ATP-binding protein